MARNDEAAPMKTCSKAVLSLLLLLLAVATPGAQTKPMTAEEVHTLHADPKAYIASLEDPERDAYQKPHDVVMALNLRDGEAIADIGAGSGYFSLRFAQHVGPGGRVWAVDISPDMIVYLNRRIRDARLDNVRTVLAVPDDPLLAPASIDDVFICDTWHHIDNHGRYLATLKTLLRPGGRVTIIDFQKKKEIPGAPFEMRVAREDVIREFEQNGYRLAKEHTFLPYQYFLVFEPGVAGS
jgi:ubiquinone/menaquinone biosynthesis C-methylase UbiE